MKKFATQGAIALVLTVGVPAYQVFAQDTAATVAPKDSRVAAIYKALTESKDPEKTIAELTRGNAADTAIIASVAAAAGISVEIVEAGIKAGNPAESTTAIIAAYNKGLNDVAAYTPATAAGQQNAANQVAQAGNTPNGGFSSGSLSSSFSGGGGGSASHN